MGQKTWLGLIVCVFCLLSGCQAGATVMDISDQTLGKQAMNISGETGSPVWLEEDLTAFMHKPEETINKPSDSQIIIFTVSTGEWYELPLPPLPDDCSRTLIMDVGNIHRLPDGNLGFIFSCTLEESSLTQKVLYVWDKNTNSLETLYEYPLYFDATRFTFSPDMTQFLQATDLFTSGELYRVELDGQMEQILPNFQRINQPRWSSDGQLIAFMGTETYPYGNPDDFRTFEEFRGLLFYPWDIYLMNADGSNMRLILSGIEEVWDLQWLPGSYSLLSFSGHYQDIPGVWLLDIETNQVIRLWPYRTGFSWSPEGNRLIVFDSVEENGVKHYSPVIIEPPLGTRQ